MKNFIFRKVLLVITLLLGVIFSNYPPAHASAEGWRLMSPCPGNANLSPTVTRNGYFYILQPGGYEMSLIQLDGTLSNWTVATWPNNDGLPYAGDAVSTTANLIYVSGGGSQNVFYPPGGQLGYVGFNPDGTLTNPVVNVAVMKSARENLASLILNGNLYLFGGYSTNLPPNGALSSVEFGPINADSSVGPFQYTSSFSQINGAVSLAWNSGNVVYCLGTDPGQSTTYLEKATLQTNGTLSPWVIVGAPSSFAGQVVLTSRTTLFLIQNYTGPIANNTFQSTFLPTTQTISNWMPAPPSLVSQPEGSIGTWDRFVYWLGGYNNGAIHTAEIYDPDLADTGLFPDTNSISSDSLQIQEISLEGEKR